MLHEKFRHQIKGLNLDFQSIQNLGHLHQVFDIFMIKVSIVTNVCFSCTEQICSTNLDGIKQKYRKIVLSTFWNKIKQRIEDNRRAKFPINLNLKSTIKNLKIVSFVGQSVSYPQQFQLYIFPNYYRRFVSISNFFPL